MHQITNQPRNILHTREHNDHKAKKVMVNINKNMPTNYNKATNTSHQTHHETP